jgi:hypothetical protein
MRLFRRGEPELEARVLTLERAYETLQSKMRQYQTEQVQMHEQVQRWMRRAVAAERATARPVVQRGHGEPVAPAARPKLGMWGARRRIAERVRRPDPVQELDFEGDANGDDPSVHGGER